ncbi:MAG: hypothetical protein RJA07_2092 [Bacteroidota bacterium]|jgi:hypothetical protein
MLQQYIELSQTNKCDSMSVKARQKLYSDSNQQQQFRFFCNGIYSIQIISNTILVDTKKVVIAK